jgi:hypothetical protein
MNPNIINELLALEAYAESLRQKCYSVRRRLEGIYPPAPSSKKKKGLSEAEISQLITARKKTILRKVK